MAGKSTNHIKLGLFAMAGLGFLVILLYIIGKNQNLFGNTFILKAHFDNVHGLMPGNNIRFSGIDAGTVKSVEVLNDTTLEVVFLIKSKMKPYLHKNATVTIGTDGLMGNKLVNIEPSRIPAPIVEAGDVLPNAPATDTDKMLQTLSNTSEELSAVVKGVRQTVDRINGSKGIWQVLDDETLPMDIRQSLRRIRISTEKIDQTTGTLYSIVADVKEGKGSVGQLLRDTAMAYNVNAALAQIKHVGVVADSLSNKMQALVASVSDDINHGKGTVHTLLKDEVAAERVRNTLKNLEQDTQSFNEVMGAVKHSFLFRGYFRKQEKKQKEAEKHSSINSSTVQQ